MLRKRLHCGERDSDVQNRRYFNISETRRETSKSSVFISISCKFGRIDCASEPACSVRAVKRVCESKKCCVAHLIEMSKSGGRNKIIRCHYVLACRFYALCYNLKSLVSARMVITLHIRNSLDVAPTGCG